MGEVCSHVGSVLYINTSRTITSCTHDRSIFNVPVTSGVQFSTVRNMDFGMVNRGDTCSD